MKKNNSIFIFLLIIILASSKAGYAQGGGPPMITDDPGTTAPHTWEINTSINTEFNHVDKFQVPLLDVNYGLNKRTQLKIEMPYFITRESTEAFSGMTGNPLLGIKFRFVNDTIRDFFISIYPQISISTHSDNPSEYKLPMQFEKDIGQWMFGEEIGFIGQSNNAGNFLTGTLVGIKLSTKLELLGEIYVEKEISPEQSGTGSINFGMRYKSGEQFVFISSLGKDIWNKMKNESKSFFSFIGVQLIF